MAKITSQQAAPPPMATHTGLPGEPLWRNTRMSAFTAPKHSGSSSRAMMVLNHFGMGESVSGRNRCENIKRGDA